MDKQDRLTKLLTSFDTAYHDFFEEAGTKIPFEFNYSGDEIIHCVAGDCTCTELKADKETGKIDGTLSLADAAYYKRKQPKGNTVEEKRYIRVYFDPTIPLHTIDPETLVMKSNPEKPIVTLELRGFVNVE